MKTLSKFNYILNQELIRIKTIFNQHKWYCAILLLIKKIITLISSFFVALMIILIRPFLKIYLVRLNSSRMGHFALSTELMLSEFEINPDKLKGKLLFFYLRISSANEQLLKMSKRNITIFPLPRFCFHVDIWLRRLLGEKYKNDFVKSFEPNTILAGLYGDGGDKNGVFRKTKPHFSFTEEELIYGKHLLAQFGLSLEDRHVCLLVRDHAYMNQSFPENDHSYHTIRNADIYTYKKAALYLAEKGYYVFRMGKYVEQTFEVNHPRIVDYANHPLRSDFLDIYLSANCYFFISTGSGLDSIACMFRRPKLITNIIFPENLSVWYPGIFFIYKKIWDRKNKKFLSLRQMIDVCMIDSRIGMSADILRQHHLELVDNTEDEILQAVCDMESHLRGVREECIEEKVVHEKFSQIFSMVRKDQDIHIRISPSLYKNGSVVLE